MRETAINIHFSNDSDLTMIGDTSMTESGDREELKHALKTDLMFRVNIDNAENI